MKRRFTVHPLSRDQGAAKHVFEFREHLKLHPTPPRPIDEEERLAVLRSYRILDTEPETQFDRIVEMARRQFDVPIALVAFMDADRNFLKARGALPDDESPRDISFCSYTILDDDVLVVPDAHDDPRFNENPLVTDNPHLRFYAGAPLIAPSGHRIGTVCVFDTKPRAFEKADRERLRDLAGVATDHLEMRRVVGRVHDEITSRRRAEAEAKRLALHDTLTGLPNRAALQRHILDLQEQGPRQPRHALYVDIDSFKQANGLLGHHQADKLLLRTAEAISKSFGAHAFIARISGDEFVALIDGMTDDEVEAKAQRVLTRLAEPMRFGSRVLATAVSAGLAVSTSTAEPPDDLIHRADLALTAAKRDGGGKLEWYDQEMADIERRRKQLANDLRGAIAGNGIDVAYQTIHSANDHRILGAEALARWTHPTLGEISPVEFIPVAEETRQIVELGDLVVERAIQDAKAWPDGFVAINLSPIQFVLADLSERLIELISAADFPTNRVQFEVTESLILQDIDLARYHIDALRGAGVRVALDDFGTGYSSLAYLRAIPFDKIKIDRSFISDIDTNPDNIVIVQHIIQLAHQLNMRVTAEGVETEHQAQMLRLAGCNSFQGFRFGRPQPAAAVEKTLLRDRRAA